MSSFDHIVHIIYTPAQTLKATRENKILVFKTLSYIVTQYLRYKIAFKDNSQGLENDLLKIFSIIYIYNML